MTLLAAILGLLLQTQATNAELGYTFTLPAGFTPFPEAAAQHRDVVECWSEETPISRHGALVLCIQRMRTTIPREAAKAEDIPGTAQLVPFKWKTFDISGMSTLATQAGETVYALVAQVPLKPEAIHIIFGGPADQEARGKELMQAALTSLEGQTNWLTDTERAGRLGNAAGWWIGIAAAATIVIILRKRRTAQA